MLKITKGLKPPIINDNSNGIHMYTDADGNRYVRVKMNGEDFCIASHDYTKDEKVWFSWDDAMKSLKNIGMTTFTKKQVIIYNNNRNEINNIFKEIGGDKLKDNWYWTSTEYDVVHVWVYNAASEYINAGGNKNKAHSVRPVLNLK